MKRYNPKIHHRRSIRLKGYDYSKAGLYFITICCQNRAHLFGEIATANPGANRGISRNNILKFNDAGMMVEKWYYELENKFPDIKCHEMIVMPNHFHCIIEIVGADLCVCPAADVDNGDNGDNSDDGDKEGNRYVGDNGDVAVNGNNQVNGGVMDIGENLDIGGNLDIGANMKNTEGEHIGSPLYRVVQWFKTMTTNEYIRGVKNNNWQRFNGKLWQRNYYEHIIRDEQSYHNITKYIKNNPAKWRDDNFHF
ncbi:MAG: transposase [Cyclobacteriaceae bacterium]